MELVRDAHDRLPSEMRIPAESPYEKLMRYTRHLTQRVGVRDDMSKNLPESTVRAIEDAANALVESVPEAINKSDGRNAITSLNALKLTLDRTRGAASSKAGSAWDDKATRCKDVAQALLNVTEADTKVTMHSQYLGGPMHWTLLRATSSRKCRMTKRRQTRNICGACCARFRRRSLSNIRSILS